MADRSGRWDRLIREHRQRSSDEHESRSASALWGLTAGLAVPWIPVLLFASGAEGLAVALAIPSALVIGASLLVLFAIRQTQPLVTGLLLGCLSVFFLGIALVD